MGFLLGLGSLVLLGHLYLYWRLVLSTGRRWRIAGTVVLTVLFVVLMTAFATQRSGPLQHFTPLHALGNVWLAMVLYLALALLVGELVRLVVLLVRRSRRPARDATPDPQSDGPAVRDPRRRLLLSRGIAIGAGVLAVGVTGWGITQALGPIRVVRTSIALPRLPASFAGYRIAVVTDIHLGALSGEERTQRVVDLVNAEQVDLVAVVGDLVDGVPEQLFAAAEPLAGLQARDGVLFTTGNHEYYSDAAAWVEALPALGVTVLHNQGFPIERGDDRLLVAGINDWSGADHDDPANLAAALADRRPEDVVVVMAHQPRQLEAVAATGADLQLAGHTHGGQVWPFHLAVVAQQGTLAGLSRSGETQLWTSRGAGFWGPPVRVGAPPDIGLITLVGGGGDTATGE